MSGIDVLFEIAFLVDPELFWGDDRLEQALAWATSR